MKSIYTDFLKNKYMYHLKNYLRPVYYHLKSFFLSFFIHHEIKDRLQFQKLAHRNDIPGLKRIWVCKFLITHVDTPGPKFFFMNTKKQEHHYLFYKKILGYNIYEKEFDAITYYSNTGRKNLAGSIVAHDNYIDDNNQQGIYSIEYWPSDPVSYPFVKLTWDLINRAMPFAADKIYYHLSSQSQINQFNDEKSLYKKSTIKLIDTDTLFKKFNFIPLNLGSSYGILRIMDYKNIPDFHDIVIFRSLPNDLSHVRGIITDVSQTPLSHVNLKAKQNNIPNAYIKNASTKKEFLKLVGRPVHFTVTADGYEIKETSHHSLKDNLENASPISTPIPDMNFKLVEILKLHDISKTDSVAFGAKASNMGELHSILSKKYAIDGNAIPFYFYDSFMKANNFYPIIEELLNNKKFLEDTQYKHQKLIELQHLIQDGKVQNWMAKQFLHMQSQYPEGSDLRLRSSSNSEDLENFNGAGLYSSFVHFNKEGPIENTIKKVWASLWTYRAFMERDFHKIAHTNIAMGILVHLDHKHEQHNGVAVTKNLFDSIWKGFYINVQSGQSLVTNPDSKALPDELLISSVGGSKKYEIQYIRRSNIVPLGQSVMQENQIFELIKQCRIIHEHFKTLYRDGNDKSFAMEIEFLTTTQGILKIMQARPWIG